MGGNINNLNNDVRHSDILKTGNDVIVKSNSLIEASYKLTLNEKRLILYMIAMIKKNDDSFRTCKIAVKDFIKTYNMNSKNAYSEIKKVIKSLTSKNIYIRDIHGKNSDAYIYIAWLASGKYEDGYLELEFSNFLKPYLLQLEKRFSVYNLSEFTGFKSVYGIRMFEVFRQYENIGHRYYNLDDLKKILGVENKYPKYSNFKQKIINVALKEVHKNSDLLINIDERKDGRKVVGLTFYIKRNTSVVEEVEETPSTVLEEPSLDVAQMIKNALMPYKYDITDEEAIAVARAAGNDPSKFFAKYPLLVSNAQSGNLKSPIGFIIDALNKDYAPMIDRNNMEKISIGSTSEEEDLRYRILD